MDESVEEGCPINRLTDDLLIKILWNTVPISRDPPRVELWKSLDPDLISIHRSESVRFEHYMTPIATPPRSSDVAVSLFNAAVCQRWRRLASDFVSTLHVKTNLNVLKEDLSSAISLFPNLTHLHLSDNSVDTVDDSFISHLASSCPLLTSLHIGWRTYATNEEHPITRDGLDHLFQGCTKLQQLSIFRQHRNDDLPASFFQLKHLKALLLTDPSVLDSPELVNFSFLTTMYLGFPWRQQHLWSLARLPQLDHLLFLSDFKDSLQSSPSSSLLLPTNLKSLKFMKACPRFDITFPLESPLTQLEQLLISKCQQLHHLPDDLGELLPCLRKLTIHCCDSLVGLPEDCTSFPRLETFIISGCRLISSLPRDFGQLPALKVLVLDCLPLTALPDSICQLTRLQALFLVNCNDITVLPAGFCRLTALKSLCFLMMPTSLVLPDDIGALSHLQVFHLVDYYQPSLPPSFVQLSSLIELDLQYCSIRALPEGMHRLENLQVIKIMNCHELEQLPSSLTDLTRLHTLVFLAENSVLPDDVFQLSSMPLRLENLTRLRDLQVSGCELLTEFPESLPQSLQVLNLGSYHPEASCPDFSLLPNLRDLTLYLPKVENGLEVSAHLPQLRRLSVQLAHEDALEVPFPLTFPELHILKIGGRYLKRLPEDIGSTLPRLRQLNVWGARLLEELPASISQLRNLTSLEVDAYYAPLSSLPGGIGSLTQLRKLRVSGSGRQLQLPPPPPAVPDSSA